MKNDAEGGWWRFLEMLSKIKDVEVLNEFFLLFLTISEKEEIGNRYWIVKELLEGGKTQREIAEAHKVSISKITRGSNALKISSSGLKKLILKHVK